MFDAIEAIVKCTNFAAIKHKCQRRKDPEQTPYINHPVGVAWLLVEAGVRDVDVLQAALLHDTVEDTDTTPQELEEAFGKKVADIVAEVTDDKLLCKAERKRQQVLHAPNCSTEAKLVKLADKLYNCRDLTRVLPEGWSKERQRQYLLWTTEVLNAGLRGVNRYLEDRLDDLLNTHLEKQSVTLDPELNK